MNDYPRDAAGRFGSGHRGPGQSPRHAISNALRRLIDPEAIAQLLIDIAGDATAKPADRLAAAREILDRTEGKSVSFSVSAHVSPDDVLPADWDQLPSADQRAWIAARRARALASGD